MRKGSKKHRLTFDIPGIYAVGGALSFEEESRLKEQDRGYALEDRKYSNQQKGISAGFDIAGSVLSPTQHQGVQNTGNSQLDYYNAQMQHDQERNSKIGGTTLGLVAAGAAVGLGAPQFAGQAFGAGNKVGSGIGGLFAEGGNLTYYNAGGTHEQNANGGVVLGNTGNSVEEGEYRMDDRVLSKKLGYADQMKKWEKKSKLRPNDSLTKELIAQKFDKLYEQQEAFKKQAQVQAQEQTMYAAYGGKLGFGGVGELDNPTLPALPNTALPPADSLKATVNKFAAPDSNGGMNLNPTMFNVAGTTQTVNPDGTISRTIPAIKSINQVNKPQFTGVQNTATPPTSTYSQEGDKFYQTIVGGQGTKKFSISEPLFNQRTGKSNLKKPSTFDINTGHALGGDLKSPYSVKDSTYIANGAAKDKNKYELKVTRRGDILYKNGKETNFNSMNALNRDIIRLKIYNDKIAAGADPNDPNLQHPLMPINNPVAGNRAKGGPIRQTEGLTPVQAAAANKRAYKNSQDQAKKEYINDYVKEGFNKAVNNPLFSTIASATPPGLAITGLQMGAEALQGDYSGAVAAMLPGASENLFPKKYRKSIIQNILKEEDEAAKLINSPKATSTMSTNNLMGGKKSTTNSKDFSKKLKNPRYETPAQRDQRLLDESYMAYGGQLAGGGGILSPYTIDKINPYTKVPVSLEESSYATDSYNPTLGITQAPNFYTSEGTGGYNNQPVYSQAPTQTKLTNSTNKKKDDKKTDKKSNVPQNKYSPLGMIAQAASPLYQGALGLLNKDTVNFEAPTLQGINPYYQARLQEQQINEQLNASRNAFRNNANTQGTFLAGMTNLGTIGADQAGQQLGQIFGNSNLYNNQINNQNLAAIAANNNLNQDIRQREKDASRTAFNNSLVGAGSAISTGVKDKYAAQSNNLYNTSMNSVIGQMFTDYLSQFNPDGTANINYRKPTVAPITAPEIVPTKKKYGGSLYKRGGKLMNHC